MKVSVRAVSALVAVTGILLVVLFVPSKSTSWPEIRIAVSETPLSAPLIIAGSNGYFQKHDLKIKLIKARGGVNCMQMLLNDEVDLATTSDSVVMFTRFERDDFGVLTSFAESDNDVKILALAASPDSPSPALENGTAGVVIDSASEFFLDAYMAMEGMNTRGIEKRGYQPHKLGEALLRKEVDYIAVWEPYSYMLSRDYPDRVFSYETRGINNLHFLLSHRTDENGESTIDREVSVRVIDALEEANRFISLYPEKAKKLVADFLSMPEAQLAYLWSDYTFRLTISDAMFLSLTMQANWAIGSGKTSRAEPPDFRDLFASSPLLPHVPANQASQ